MMMIYKRKSIYIEAKQKTIRYTKNNNDKYIEKKRKERKKVKEKRNRKCIRQKKMFRKI